MNGNELERVIDALDNIAAELERLRILKEHELGVRLEHAEGGHGPYVKKQPGFRHHHPEGEEEK